MRYIIKRALTAIYLLSLCSVCSCGQEQNNTEEVRIHYPNGQLKIKGSMLDGKKHGQSETYYDNGQIQTRNDWQNGVQVGLTNRWYRNGHLEYTGQFKNGVEYGEWDYFDDVDGMHLFSVINQGGTISAIAYNGEKYKWRRLNLERALVSIEFPLPIDSTEVTDELDGFWAMFPFTSKKDFEYYGLAIVPIEMSVADIDFEVAGEPEKRLNFLRRLFGDDNPDSNTPNVLADGFSVVSAERATLGANPAYHLLLNSSTLSAFLESWLIPRSEDGDVVLAFVYYNEKVDRAAPTRFFDSIKLLE